MDRKENNPNNQASVDNFLSILNNPFLRLPVKFFGKECSKCGVSHLEVALNSLAENKELPTHFKSKISYYIVEKAINIGCKAFGVSEEKLKEAIRVPYFRRGLINVLRGIAEYGISKPQRLTAPFLVVWNYTNACNLKCKHCYQRAERPALDELTTEERLEVVDQIDEVRVASIAFSGGEPIIRKDFFEVAKYAYEKGIYVSLATNGTLITEDVAKRLNECGVSYAEVSLDGAFPQTHETFRGMKGCFDRTIQGIKNLVKNEIFTCIAITATKFNFYEIPDIINLAKSLRVKRVIVFNFIPTGRGEEIVNLDLSPKEREDLLIYLHTELVNGNIEALCTAPQYARVCLQQSSLKQTDVLSPTHFASANLHGQTKALADFIGGCGAGRLYCAIQPNGIVTPCVFMPIIVGDLRRKKLRDVWLESEVMDELRDREKLKGRCGKCEYKYVCGGCRARAYAYYQDYLAPDPGCIRELEESSKSFLKENLKIESTIKHI
ncbi:MAG: radical SAM protein [Candidatus Bathyarchaeia archaeon]